MATTIRDIAQKTGLSVSTVSLVLNHKKHRISKETCDRVFAAAKEMNYHPNHAAVSLITKRTKAIGLIIPDITNMFFAEIAKGAETRCQELGFSVFLCNTNDKPEKDVEYVNVLLDRGVDGFLLVTSFNASENMAAECFKALRPTEKPIVLVDRVVSTEEYGTSLPCVQSDNELGGYLATKHLLELGHRSIGCITGPMGAQSSQHRLFGHIRALQEAGITFNPALVREGNYHTQTGFSLSSELLDQGVTAIFACNDMMAYGVYRQASQRGMRVPEDLSIVGFDDLPFSEFAEAPLTTVKQPAYLIGECAASKIIGMINNPGEVQENVQFKPELIVRKSTSKPNQHKGAGIL